MIRYFGTGRGIDKTDVRYAEIKEIFVFDRDLPPDASFTFVDFASGFKIIEIEGVKQEKFGKKYADLVDYANDWLANRLEWELVFCETVKTFMKLNNEIMLAEYTGYNADLNCEMILFRVWLKRRSEADIELLKKGNTKEQQATTSSKQADCIQQKVKYIDFIPEILSEKGGKDEVNFETLDDLIKKINEKIKNEEIGGRIINVQTVKCPADESTWECDAEETDPKSGGKYLFIIRVFYFVGPAGDCTVGIADFIPQHISGGGLFSWPKFESQKQVLAKISTWISENPEIIFCNAQTIDILLISRTNIDSQRMAYSKCYGDYIRFIRVVYLKPPDIPDDIPQTAFQPPPAPVYFSTKIFNIGSSNQKSIDNSYYNVKKSLSEFFWNDNWFHKEEKNKWRFLSVESINVYLGRKSNLIEGIDCSFQNNFLSKTYSSKKSDCRNKDIFYAIRVFYDVGYFSKDDVTTDEMIYQS